MFLFQINTNSDMVGGLTKGGQIIPREAKAGQLMYAKHKIF